VARAIVMIHGMGCTGKVWETYAGFFESRGWRVITPTLRHHDIGPDDPPPAALGATSLLDYAADLEAEIRALDETPVLMGHSMGGLLTQMLAARGVARAAVLITPAAPAGVMAVKASVIRIFARQILTWGFWRKPGKFNWAEMRYGIFNRLPEDEARALFANAVWESGRAASEIAFWLLDPRRAARVESSRVTCPVLTLGATHDRITPASVVRQVTKRYPHGAYKELPEHGHWVLSGPGWETVAGFAADWLDELAPFNPP
jgi:pimeloyl-ACP methyl ester carboxylesterase